MTVLIERVHVLLFFAFVFLSYYTGVYADETSCIYYPDYPDKTAFYSVNCSNICCPSQTDKIKEQERCCAENSTTWIVYPIVATSIIITLFVGYFVCCRNHKKNVTKPQSSQQNTQIQVASIYRDPNDPTMPSLVAAWDDSAPPSYNEVITSLKTQKNPDESKEPAPVLPGAINTYRSQQNNTMSQVETSI